MSNFCRRQSCGQPKTVVLSISFRAVASLKTPWVSPVLGCPQLGPRQPCFGTRYLGSDQIDYEQRDDDREFIMSKIVLA